MGCGVGWGEVGWGVASRGDAETREEESKGTTVQPWARILVPPKRIHITVSLSYFADTECPPGGRR